jgi:putative glutamine amidotransferase
MNVALGGSLHQAVQEVEPARWTIAKIPACAGRAVRPGPPVPWSRRRHGAHPRRWPTIMVNSLHGQGIHRLAPGLAVEARADDGLVEAFSVAVAPGFTLALQWHPEWRIAENPDSMKCSAPSAACREAMHPRAALSLATLSILPVNPRRADKNN